MKPYAIRLHPGENLKKSRTNPKSCGAGKMDQAQKLGIKRKPVE